MWRVLIPAVLIFAAASPALARRDDPKPSEQLSKLATDYNEIFKTFRKAVQADRSQDARRAAAKEAEKSLKEWTEKALDAVKKYPAESETVDVIQKLMERNKEHVGELVAILRKDHKSDPRLARMVGGLYSSDDEAAWKFALEIADSHPDRAVRGRASLMIGRIAKMEWVSFEEPRGEKPDYSAEKVERLRKNSETYLTRAAKEYADVKEDRGDETIGPEAKAQLIGLANMPKLKVGKEAPDIEGVDLKGEKMKLSDQRGKVVLLVFWASWCGPCMADVPHERELVEKFKDRPFAIVGVNGDDEVKPAKEAVDSKKMTWRSYAPVNMGVNGGIPSAWNITAWPTTYVIDPKGVIRHINLRRDELDKPLEELVAEVEKAGKKDAEK